MPVCSYIVIPHSGEVAAVQERLAALQACDVVRATNEDILLLVTDTNSAAEEEELRFRLRAVPGIADLVLTFGELNDGDSPGTPDPGGTGVKARRDA